MNDTAFALREPGYEIDIAGIWNTPSVKGGSGAMGPGYAR